MHEHAFLLHKDNINHANVMCDVILGTSSPLGGGGGGGGGVF